MREKQIVFESHLEPWYPFVDVSGKVALYNVDTKQACAFDKLELRIGDNTANPTFMNFRMNNDKISLKFVFCNWGSENVFEEIFDEHYEWYRTQMAILQQSYETFKNSKYLEARVFFEKQKMISYNDINDADFLQYLIDRVSPSLQFGISAIYVESFGANLLKSLTVTFRESFFNDALSLKIFAEYSNYKENQFNEMLEVVKSDQMPPMPGSVQRTDSAGKEAFVTIPAIKLGHRQIALLYYYLRRKINKNSATEVAEKHGLTSGQKLLEHVDKVTIATERRNTKYSKANITKVIEILTKYHLGSIEEANADLKFSN